MLKPIHACKVTAYKLRYINGTSTTPAMIYHIHAARGHYTLRYKTLHMHTMSC